MDNKLINNAYLFALEKHKDQKYGDKPFIYHLLQTYEILTLLCPEDVSLRASGLCHDLCEDQAVTLQEIEKETNADVAGLVQEVTATEYNRFPSLLTIRGTILLTASRLANITNMQGWDEKKKFEYVFKKTKYWLP